MSDWVLQFVVRAFQAFSLSLSSSYQLQFNSVTKRPNQVAMILWLLCASSPTKWTLFLPWVIYTQDSLPSKLLVFHHSKASSGTAHHSSLGTHCLARSRWWKLGASNVGKYGSEPTGRLAPSPGIRRSRSTIADLQV